MVQFCIGLPAPSFSTPEIRTAIFPPQKSPPEPAGCHNTVLAGVQFNPTESVAVDVAYEGSGSGDW
ncbi:Ail/Lom family outer membrane beta-barrel protein, partial [Bacillus sp. HC-TM]